MSVTVRPAMAGPTSSVTSFLSPLSARPLAVAASFYAAGDAAGLAATPRLTFIAGGLLFAAAVLLATVHRRERRPNFRPILIIGIASAAVGLLRGGLATVRPLNDVSFLAGGRFVDLRGTVAAEPQRQGPGWGLLIRAERVTLGDGRHVLVGGTVQAWLPYATRWGAETSGPPSSGPPSSGLPRPANTGDRITLHGNLERPEAARNPGGFSTAAFFAARSVSAMLTCRRPRDLLSRSPGSSSPLYRLAASVRASFEDAMVRTCGARDAALITGIVFGARTDLPERLEDDFARTGTVHVLATAGLHVGLLSAGLMWLWRVFRVSRKGAALATIGCLVVYVLAAGARPAMTRAVLMACIYLAAYLLDREPDGPTALGAAALWLLGCSPELVLDSGFQLSFVTVAVIFGMLRIGVGPGSRESSTGRARQQGWAGREREWFASHFRSLFKLSFAAQLGAAPLTAYYFHLLSPISLVANMVVVPIVALSLAGSLLLWPLAAAAPAAATAVCGWTLRPLLHGMASLVQCFAAIPGASWSAGSPDAVETSGVYLAVIACILWANNVRQAALLPSDTSGSIEPQPDAAPSLQPGRVACLAAAMAMVSWVVSANVLTAPRVMRVTFLDVGQGDAIVIETPDSRTLVVDAGPPSGSSSQGMRTVVPYLRARGVQTVDALLLTHGDLDHIGGAADVVDRIDTRRLLEGGAAGATTEEALVRGIAKRRGAELRSLSRGDRIDFRDGVTATVLHPADWRGRNATMSDNDSSVVLRLDYGRTSILLTGDAEAPSEYQMVDAEAPLLRADILKLGHHGSRTSTSERWLHAVRPQAAVVSCGLRNAFGHPHPDVVARLESSGIPLLRTDRDGAVIVESDGNRLLLSKTIRP